MLKKIGLTVAGVSILSTTILISEHVSGKNAPEPSPVILQTAKEELIEGKHYIPSSIKNIQWGSLPNKNSKP
ncbi:MAG TPA: hypothetical protein VEY51_15940, partial [Chondromyces sp.]|nr:hypothetical protein [Chondromyces sp.]